MKTKIVKFNPQNKKVNKLTEDVGEVKLEEKEIMTVTMISNLINNLIKDEWEAIEGYNQAIITLNVDGQKPEITAIFNDILAEEYIHVGQLEKALQLIVPEAEKIEDGKDEADEVVSTETESEEEVEEKDSSSDLEDVEDEADFELYDDQESDDVPADTYQKVNFTKK